MLCSQNAILSSKCEYLSDSSPDAAASISTLMNPDEGKFASVPQIDNFLYNSFLLRCVISQEFALLPFGSKEKDDKGYQSKTVDVLYERT